MGDTCDDERCFCCGRGHFCEPPTYPSRSGEEWTCPECGRRHESYYVNEDPRTPPGVLRHLAGPTWGWRSATPPPAQRDPAGLTDGGV